MAAQTFRVSKQKTSSSGNKMYSNVGTMVLREDGKSGVLFLNMFEGDFLLTLKKPEEKDDSEA